MSTMRLRGSIAIDLGTASTLIWVAGRGLVIDEPSAIAIDATTGKVAAVGAQADALAGKEPEDIEIIYPLRDGVIADLNATALMLNGFLHRATRHPGPLRPRALVAVPSRATWVERRSVAAALEARRPRAMVRLVDEPVAAAAGAGIDLAAGTGAFVVDVGGGTTEIAVVSGARVVRAQSLRLAGNAMDDAIVHAARAELGLILGQKAAAGLKMELGISGGFLGWAEAVGIDTAQRTPRIERVPSKLVAKALEHTVATIIHSIEEILSDIPPGIAEDVVRGKIRLAGGGALLPGLASRIESTSDIATVVVDDPLRCVIRGAAELLERGEEFGRVGLQQ
jgi:rod shape-determining protein MreB